MKLEDIARESRATHKGDKSGVPIVGLEHLVPQEIKFTGYDVDTENTFTKAFKKGQILFGRRRAYLKKAAIADFDGICSGDITVIEAIPGKVEPLLLPFIIQNDKFFDYAVSRSAGGLSPRVKWEHLKDYELDLPPIDEQRILADKLWAAYRLKESYKKLLTATQEMVKSQFIEMFNFVDLSLTNPSNDFGKKCFDDTSSATKVPASDYQKSGKYAIYDQSQDSVVAGYTDSKEGLCENYPAVLFGDHSRVLKYINQPFYIGADGVKIIRPKEDDLLPEFLYYDLLYHNIPNTGYNRHFKYIKMLKLTEATTDKQKEFLEIAHQADKSEFVGFKSQFIEMFGNTQERVSLSSLCDIFIDGDWIEAKDQSESGIRLIQTGNIGVGVYKDKDDKARYISEDTFYRLNCTEVIEGDILISRLPDPVGRACVIPSGLGKCITAVDCTIIRLNNKVLPEYFIAFTNTPDYAMQIKKVLSGTTRLRVSRANLGKIEVPLPSKEEQIKFVAIAKQADKSEFELRKSIDAIDQVIKSLINN